MGGWYGVFNFGEERMVCYKFCFYKRKGTLRFISLCLPVSPSPYLPPPGSVRLTLAGQRMLP